MVEPLGDPRNPTSPADDDGGGSGLRLVPAHANGGLEQGARLQAIADAFPGALVVERAGWIVHANEAAARLRGQALDVLVGLRYSTLGWGSHPPAARAEVQVVGADGGSRLLELRAAKLPGAPQETVVFARELGASADPIARLYEDHIESLGRLAAGVAHELGNPLTYVLVNVEHVARQLRVLGASGRLHAGLPPEDAQALVHGLVEPLGQALEGTKRSRDLVRHLLTFARGSVGDRRGIADVRAVIESALHMTWHQIRHRARVERDLADVPPVDASEARLGQVFLALLGAVTRGIPEGASERNVVRVAARLNPERRVHVEIAGHGGPIVRRERLTRLFDPFFVAEDQPGGGLDLAVAHGIVASLGGQISTRALPDGGIGFDVVLEPSRGWLLARKRVLVVDEEPMVCEAVALGLLDDCDVVSTTRATEALALLVAGEVFDVVLCDLALPEMSGAELYCAALRDVPESVGRFVFLTGGGVTSRTRAFLDSVKRPCVTKPVEIGDLRRAMALLAR